MALMTRRILLGSIGLAALPLVVARAQMDWYADQHRRAEYERWREHQWHLRQEEAEREHRTWNRQQWNEQQEREAWAHQQPWYR